PAKPHTALRDETGRLRYEECLTREGFDGPFTILYHQHRPHTPEVAPVEHGWQIPGAATEATVRGGAGVGAAARGLERRHYRTQDLSRTAGEAPVDARVPLLFNSDLTLSVLQPRLADPVYF